jgi:hypothetical protein
MQPRVVDPNLWSYTPRKILIDLSGVKSFEDFTRVMEVEFPLEEDPREIWIAIRHWLLWQSQPLEVRFCGWAGFEERMPRYARKLKEIFRTHVGRLSVDYSADMKEAPNQPPEPTR